MTYAPVLFGVGIFQEDSASAGHQRERLFPTKAQRTITADRTTADERVRLVRKNIGELVFVNFVEEARAQRATTKWIAEETDWTFGEAGYYPLNRKVPKKTDQSSKDECEGKLERSPRP
jgi:hypothetical protein